MQKIGKLKQVQTTVSAAKEGRFPLEIEGCEGAFGALLLAKLYLSAPGLYFAVVSRENDVSELINDLSASGIPCAEFPWWGAVPYRELVSSAVFGDRVKVLSEITAGNRGVIVLPQRAFLTPLPPPEYIKSLIISGAVAENWQVKTGSNYRFSR